MTEQGDHNKFFDLVEKMLDSVLKAEPRFQKIEFRTTIMWWVMTTLGGFAGVMIIWFVQKQF